MLRILIAEDDMTSRLFMEKYLKRYGQCDVVMNGLEAIDKFNDAIDSETPYDLVCLDIMMPKINGIRALKEIRDIEGKMGSNKKVAIIMTTALNDKETVDDALNSGCDAYLWKPLDVEVFDEQLRELNLI